MKRKKYHLDGIKSLKERKQYATELIARLTEQLRNGWNVWCEVENTREMSSIKEVMEFYSRYLERAEKVGSLKKKTVYGYQSFLKIFIEWIDNRVCKIMYCYQLTTPVISDFLDYVLMDREASARTRNNYRVWLSTMFVWLIEKGFATKNHAESVKTLKEEETKRDPLNHAQLKMLRKVLDEEDKYFLLACMWAYYTLIRPKELSFVRIGDISIKEQRVFVPGEVSKNRRDGMVGLNADLIRLMIDLGVFNAPADYYLFGKDCKPSAERADSRIFRERFAKLRKKLGWSSNLHFYSLKASGIRDLANAEGIVVARDQARHTDITTTNKYLKGSSLTVPEQTKHFKGAL